ncbi:spore photoproduct lyase [Clostridium chauvoei]|uniref:Spore photoproduct lyase n=2 Tax=Clostridium chauvoei TaxID=46867 RepID=A0ABD4RFZ4_9CLOT|nr:spore photoproduct lyase [Clostridium chauvoei]ATD55803.1 spore photoproduct lyase [Clostridium chauvoei]ATD56523.1 spore photoproduct lyase [Clostridium chauvoei]MBX7280160.1 spore photoproduct lyase [Clostridium chauvoei]MBX7285051.1 spore photoproduct lyase [Clostridium chauvoei]MBX7287557.1 spore photoproduct lyase [Clostridium chauvoei]
MFIPEKVVFDEKALNYTLGIELLNRFKKEKIEIQINKTGRVTGDTKESDTEKFFSGKRTLVVGVRGDSKFQTCKPSAHYQLPLVSGCMGMCEYCYLNTQLGKRPYTKIYVDIDEILNKAFNYAEERLPEITIFEGSATSDPIPVENYTHALKKAIEAFGSNDNTRFRFVSKFNEVHELLGIKHNGHTTIRFSINTNEIIKKYEHGTNLIDERLEAAKKIKEAGYKLGFIIAPVFIYKGWKEEYLELINKVKNMFDKEYIEFEVISHRFTERAKKNILSIYPSSTLPMSEEERKFKFGQFGYGKYIYKDEELKEIKGFFKETLSSNFGEKSIKYII